MARSRFKTRPKRKLAFKNRERILADVTAQLSASHANKSYFRIVQIVGVGGCGKTRLIDKLSEQAKSRGFIPIRVSLESEASNMEAGPLQAIRKQLGFECMLFDTALAAYLMASGQMHALASNKTLSSNIALKGVETAAGVSGLVALPLGFAVEAYDRIKKATVKAMKYAREDFEEIDRMRTHSSELLERLPFYLGSDIERRLESTSDHFVFFYDSYEKQRAQTLADKAPWLREFVGSLEAGLHLFASREPMDWPQDDWGDICQAPYIIDTLPKPDVEALFLEECGPPKRLLPKLVELSRCIPFYVEILITEYLSMKDAKGAVRVTDLPKSSTEAVARFIDHLDDPVQKLVVSLATVQFFDRPLLSGLIRALNLAIDLTEHDEILSAFFIEIVDDNLGIYKTHDLLTEFVRLASGRERFRQQALFEAAKVVSIASLDDVGADGSLHLFAGLCAGSDFGAIKDPGLVALLLDIGYGLYDKGYWQELAGLSDSQESEASPSDSDLVRQFFKSISTRRIESIAVGLSGIRTLHGLKERFGRHRLSVEIETAYLTELAGDYGLAREQIRGIFKRCVPIDPMQRPHYRALLYHADFLIMDGELSDGADILLSVYEGIDPSRRSDWAELVRHRAHAFRFSALFEDADGLYARAIEAAGASPALIAKLHTNVAETQCWTLPDKALEAADDAIELNTRLGNIIEISKARSAKAIALARLADATARDARYPAGALFAKQAQCLIEFAEGHTRLVEARHQEAVKLARQIGTYRHLTKLTSAAAGAATEEFSSKVISWIEPDTLEKRHTELLDRLRSVG